jgi:orotate phosphoribosyltransferase
MAGDLLGDFVLAEVPNATHLVGLAFAGIPLAISASLSSGIPAGMTRKLEGIQNVSDLEAESSKWGEHSLAEGRFNEGARLVLIDDLVTRFDSKLIAVEQIAREFKRRRIQDWSCRDVVVLIDREQGADTAAAKAGIHLHALIKFRSEALALLRADLHPREYEVISEYLDAPDLYQNEQMQAALRNLAKERPS